MKKLTTTAANTGPKSRSMTIGLDLGDRSSHYCVLDESGRILTESKTATSPNAMKEVFGNLARARITLETGVRSPWVSRLLSKFGHEVIVAHARNVRLIGESRRKDDRLDAQTLARLARIDPQLLLAFMLIIGEAERFHCGKQIASYIGLVPAEDSSGERQRLGHISKQGNSLLRFLLVEAAQATVRSDRGWRNQFFHLAKRRGRNIARVAMARRLAVRLYWMWRKGWDYQQLQSFGSHAGQPENLHGV